MSIIDVHLPPDLSDIVGEYLLTKELLELKIPITHVMLEHKIQDKNMVEVFDRASASPFIPSSPGSVPMVPMFSTLSLPNGVTMAIPTLPVLPSNVLSLGFPTLGMMSSGPPYPSPNIPRLLNQPQLTRRLSSHDEDIIATSLLLGHLPEKIDMLLPIMLRWSPLVAKKIFKKITPVLSSTDLTSLLLGECTRPSVNPDVMKTLLKSVLKLNLNHVYVVMLALQYNFPKIVWKVIDIGINPCSLMWTHMYSLNQTITADIVNEYIETMPLKDLAELVKVLLNDTKLAQIMFKHSRVFELSSPNNILALTLGAYAKTVPLLLDSPYFQPSSVKRYLMESKLLVAWLPGLRILVRHHKVRDVPREDWLLLAKQAELKKKPKVATFFNSL